MIKALCNGTQCKCFCLEHRFVSTSAVGQDARQADDLGKPPAISLLLILNC